MTREEASVQIEGLKKYCEDMADSDESGAYVFDLDVQALDLALTALRSVSRERVGKVWRGKWKIIEYEFFTCSRCGDSYYNGAESHEQAESYLNSGYVYDFCPHCGSANTDKAVEMVMERLEALKDG